MEHVERRPGRGRGYGGYGGHDETVGEGGPGGGFTAGYLGSYGYGPWYGWGNGPWYGEGQPGMPGPHERHGEPGPWRRGEWRPGERHGGHSTKGLNRADSGRHHHHHHHGQAHHGWAGRQGMGRWAMGRGDGHCPTCGREWPVTATEHEEKREALERHLEGLRDEMREVKWELERLEAGPRH